MRRIHVLALAVSGVLAAGCASESGGRASGDGRSEAAETRPTEAAAAPKLAEPAPETADARNDRLLRLEQACERWYLAAQRQDYEQQASIERLLRTYVGDHFDLVVSDLKTGSPRHRRTMAAALGFCPRADAVPPLMEALKDQYKEVVEHALLSLYNLAKSEVDGVRASAKLDKLPPSALGPIRVDPEKIAPYLSHPEKEIRSNAALVLSRAVGPGASNSLLLALIAATADVDAATRVHAIGALGATRDREAFPHLVRALRDPVKLVRVRAALALGRMKDPDAVPDLVKVLADKKESIDVQRSAAKSLNEITGCDLDSLDATAWTDAAKSKGMMR